MSQNNKQQQIKEKGQAPAENKQAVEKNELDINNLLSGFEEQNQLNLTGDQKDKLQQDEKAMKQIKQQYQKFMKQMGSGDINEGDLGMGNLGKAFEQLLKGLTDDEQTGNQIGKKFQDMFQNIDNPMNFQNAATDLLNQFMDKSLLEQPLKQTKQNYEKYFKKLQQQKQDKKPEYQKQYQIILELLDSLHNNPSDKKKMIDLFSKLQEQGNPPQGIAPSSGFF